MYSLLISVADPGFPVGGRGPRRRGCGLPRQLRFENFVCQNERIGTLGGGRAPLDPPMNMIIVNIPNENMYVSGLMAGGVLSAYYVVINKFSVGDFVLYMTYIQQLYEPLNHLGAYYRFVSLFRPHIYIGQRKKHWLLPRVPFEGLLTLTNHSGIWLRCGYCGVLMSDILGLHLSFGLIKARCSFNCFCFSNWDF